MSLRHVKRSTLAQQIALQLERAIDTGEWAPGEMIPPEPVLAERFGVSRNTLREAIRALTLLGILEPRPGSGTYVRETSVLRASVARRIASCSFEQTLEARECLERSAARLAAERRTDEEVRELREGADAIDRAVAAGETTEALTALAFAQEERLFRMSRNPILIELLGTIAEPVREAIRTTIERIRDNEALATVGCRLGRRLIDEIAAGDPVGAADAITEKTRMIREWLLLPDPPEEDDTR